MSLAYLASACQMRWTGEVSIIITLDWGKRIRVVKLCMTFESGPEYILTLSWVKYDSVLIQCGQHLNLGAWNCLTPCEELVTELHCTLTRLHRTLTGLRHTLLSYATPYWFPAPYWAMPHSTILHLTLNELQETYGAAFTLLNHTAPYSAMLTLSEIR